MAFYAPPAVETGLSGSGAGSWAECFVRTRRSIAATPAARYSSAPSRPSPRKRRPTSNDRDGSGVAVQGARLTRFKWRSTGRRNLSPLQRLLQMGDVEPLGQLKLLRGLSRRGGLGDVVADGEERRRTGDLDGDGVDLRIAHYAADYIRQSGADSTDPRRRSAVASARRPDLEKGRAQPSRTASTPSPFSSVENPASRSRFATSAGRSRPVVSLLGAPV